MPIYRKIQNTCLTSENKIEVFGTLTALEEIGE